MGRDGLQIHTRQPPPVGKIIEIEINRRAESEQSHPIITRGRVVRVQELRDGEYSVGVKLRYRVRPVATHRSRPATQPHAAPPVTLPSKRARKPAKGKWDIRHPAVIAFFILLIALVYLWPRPMPRQNGAVSSGSTVVDRAPTSSSSPNGVSRGDAADDGPWVQPLVPQSKSLKTLRERVSLGDHGWEEWETTRANCES